MRPSNDARSSAANCDLIAVSICWAVMLKERKPNSSRVSLMLLPLKLLGGNAMGGSAGCLCRMFANS